MAQKQKTIVGTATISAGDVTSVTLDWAPWLDKTGDVIYDFDFSVTGGLPVKDAPFTETDTTLLVGPGVKGRTYVASFDITIDPETGEKYHRELKIRCR